MCKLSNISSLLLFVMFISVICTSCSGPKKPKSDEGNGWNVHITHRAGDRLGDQSLLALPFNLGRRDSLTYIILGDRITDRDSAGVRILGGIELRSKEKQDNYILCLNTLGMDTTSTMDFMEFTTLQAHNMWMIEHYMKHTLGYREVYKWYDADKAQKIIDTY